MTTPVINGQPCLYTVGHSNLEPEKFLDLLKSHLIEVLVDVRSQPYSRYVPHFNQGELQALLQSAGLRYLFMGRELGGRPHGDEYYDDDGRVLYDRLAASEIFLEGISRLETGIRRYRVAIMCSEENPTVCHRYLLVGRVMADRGAAVHHIRADGGVQRQEELDAAPGKQPSLFESGKETTWKSLRPVLQKSPPRTAWGASSLAGSED
jgi:uncharacterized protein (DUF488 family)